MRCCTKDGQSLSAGHRGKTGREWKQRRMGMLVMLVKDRMSPRFITIGPDASLAAARALLDQHRIRHLPVVEDGNPVGIITDRVIRWAAPTSLLGQVRGGEGMTKKLIMVT